MFLANVIVQLFQHGRFISTCHFFQSCVKLAAMAEKLVAISVKLAEIAGNISVT